MHPPFVQVPPFKTASRAADGRRVKRIVLLLAVAAMLVLSLRAGTGAGNGYDYFQDASSAVDALARGDLSGFLQTQPLMGSFSVLVRAPFVAAVYHADVSTVYLVGSLPCLLAALALGLVLARSVADAGGSAAAQGLVAGLAIVNPLTFRALHWGHPEELLGAALCVAAVVAALRERQVLAGVFLGLALATKQWAVIAMLPVLLAAPDRRVLLGSIAAGVASALTLPLFLLAPDQAAGVAAGAAGQGSSSAAAVTPWNIWWPLGTLRDFGEPLGERYVLARDVARVSHPLIVLLPIPLTWALWRRTDRRRDDALLLLALLFLLRCVLDNWNNEYYHLPFVLSLLAWETIRFRTVPRLTLAVVLLLGATFFPGTEQGLFRDSTPHAPLWFALYMSWVLPLTAGLTVALYRPDLADRLARSVPRRLVPAT